MNMQIKRRAVRLYSTPWVPLHTNKYNRRAWLRSVNFLGDRWLLAVPIKREATQ